MAVYKFGNVDLVLESENIKIDFEILKDDLLWKTETMYLSKKHKEVDDIVEKIMERAWQLISYYEALEEIFPDVEEALEGTEIKAKGVP